MDVDGVRHRGAVAGLKGIPSELIEAARVDGASEWQVFRHVILPLLRPVLIVVAVTLTINALKVFDLLLSIVPLMLVAIRRFRREERG